MTITHQHPSELGIRDLGNRILLPKPWGCFGILVALEADDLGGDWFRIRTTAATGETVCSHALPRRPQEDQ